MDLWMLGARVRSCTTQIHCSVTAEGPDIVKIFHDLRFPATVYKQGHSERFWTSTFHIGILQTSVAVELLPLKLSGLMMLCLKSSWHETVFHLVSTLAKSKTYLYRNSNHMEHDQIADEYSESFVVSKLNLFTLELLSRLKS